MQKKVPIVVGTFKADILLTNYFQKNGKLVCDNVNKKPVLRNFGKCQLVNQDPKDYFSRA